jgi:hypothetical protein
MMTTEAPKPVAATDCMSTNLQAHEGGIDEILCPGTCNAGWLRITQAGRGPVHRLNSYNPAAGDCPRSGAEFIRPADLPAPLDLQVTRDAKNYRWNVYTSTGRRLGWLTHHDNSWSARVSPQAFLGDSPEDHGNDLDKVPWYHTKQFGPCQHEPVGGGSTRAEAVRALVKWCGEHGSPAFGHGRHPDVDRWEDRRGKW